MKQIPIKDWPVGLSFPLAMISAELLTDLELTFEVYHEDGLGPHFAALVDVPEGPFAIRRAVRIQGPEIDVCCMFDDRFVADHIDGFLRAFGMAESEILWRSPLKRTSLNSEMA